MANCFYVLRGDCTNLTSVCRTPHRETVEVRRAGEDGGERCLNPLLLLRHILSQLSSLRFKGPLPLPFPPPHTPPVPSPHPHPPEAPQLHRLRRSPERKRATLTGRRLAARVGSVRMMIHLPSSPASRRKTRWGPTHIPALSPSSLALVSGGVVLGKMGKGGIPRTCF